MAARAPRITEADIPSLDDMPTLADPPQRSLFADDASYVAARAQHSNDARRRDALMKERRKLQQRLREQNRAPRDRSDRVRPANDSTRRVEQRQQLPQQIEDHREREAARYEAHQLPPSERNIAAASYVVRGEQAPGWGRVTRAAMQAATARYLEKCRKQTLDRVSCDVPDTLEDIVRTLERRDAFATPHIRLFIEQKRMIRDFDAFRAGSGVCVSSELTIVMGAEWVRDVLDEEGAFALPEDRRDFELITYIGFCVPRCHRGTIEQLADWLAWDEDTGEPLSLPTWACFAGRDAPGPQEVHPRCLTTSSYDHVITSSGRLGDLSCLEPTFYGSDGSDGSTPAAKWPNEWWTFDKVDAHCRCQAQRWLWTHPTSWRDVPGLLCAHDACRWQCNVCRDTLVSEAIDLRFVGGDALQAWLHERACERRDYEAWLPEYEAWRECRDVVSLIVQRIERRELKAKQKAEAEALVAAAKAAKAAADAARDARVGSELAAAGLERITAANASRYPPPKLWARNRRKDAYLHVIQVPMYPHIRHRGACYECDACRAWIARDASRRLGREHGWRLRDGEEEEPPLREAGVCPAVKAMTWRVNLQSAPVVWFWQLTGTHITDDRVLLELHRNCYDNAVRQWHRLMGRPMPKRYRTDHRGRGGHTVYVLREPLEPLEPSASSAPAGSSRSDAQLVNAESDESVSEESEDDEAMYEHPSDDSAEYDVEDDGRDWDEMV